MKIAIIDDERSIRRSLEMFLQKKGYTVLTAEDGEKGLLVLENERPEILILDIRLPGMDGLEVLRAVRAWHPAVGVIMITAYHDMDTTIQAMKSGAYEYIHKPIDVDELEIVIDKVAGNIKLSGRLDDLITEISRDYKVHNIVGQTPAMQEIFKTIGLVSENRATVLIRGETGTGKELIAKTIHYNSVFAKEPFVPVNCSTLVENLFESELFGHEKGAFTGAAYQKKGKVELAQNGTVLFDEIGDISSAVQVKLLRFLQERQFERVGGTERLHFGARVISATNRDLPQLVEEGKFREDLYFRLNVVEIHVPPLRERRSDIPLLIEHLLHKINLDLHKNVRKVPRSVMNCLTDYHWPGNVRELENVLTRSVVLCKGDVLSPDQFSHFLAHDEFAPGPLPSNRLDEVVKQHVVATLRHTGWHKGKTCEMLGISRPTLRDMIRKYNLSPRVGE